jgi:hypothetical protein
MAKIKAPLFSLDATGTLDKNITYKENKQNKIAQKYSKPGSANPFESSPRQKDQRSIIRLITIHWQCMTDLDKLSWETAAKDARFKGTGYHYFLHMAQQNLTQYLGLVGYWSMNYNVNDKIPDLSGNGNDGTLSPIYPCDSPTTVQGPDTKHGKALFFNGVSTFLSMPLTPAISTSDSFSVLVLFKPLTLSIWRSLFSLSSSDKNRSLYYCHASNNIFYYTTLSDLSQASIYSVSIIPYIDKWVYLVLTYDHPTRDYKFFINGTYQNHKSFALDEHLPSTTVQIGRNGVRFGDSIVDDFLLYNKCLSSSEVNKISYFLS